MSLWKHPPGPEILRKPKADPSALAKLLDEWMHGDEAEQRETFEVLRASFTLRLKQSLAADKRR